ncbi:MAG: DNA-directed RNA polymerase subunit omega [Candidatus Latescibacteria bacterium 4484_181]|nr:DNA-directed RNA polymerase subunit omega [Candidatus Latescibacterota bacterium]OPX31400.1 MAG: DNA-directed RNA polymerase subunit omega [Candidatus Latescibacteria bacterium 4484_181]RKY69066.1 MAG: DNA-directed RNA polymerase subunit omega [Candidatus Latescibacterota bacterium]RKY72834.1 MAG: DNA-directed RNA polymerase subunit omega [Candidatus Latescibacterota bacterium]
MAVIPVEKLEESGANPYEIVIAAAKRAKMLGELKGEPETNESDEKEEKPAIQALKELAEGKIKCVYLAEKRK